MPNRALPDRLLVEFRSDHSLYDLDLATGVLLRVTSTNPGEAPHCVPALRARHDVVYSASHATNGHMYVFARLVHDPEIAIPGTPIARDLDRDGVLDDFIFANRSNEASYGLDDPTLFE